MDAVQRQYEAYPYPERDPSKEAETLLIGSPSHPLEIDHFLFGGKRDWTQPFRALVAGGGTGDGLVMLAQVLADWGAEAEIHYLDMSEASRRIAEARIAARGIEGVTFHTGDLMSAPERGPFDYIDCCGVLHHLPDPVAGAKALREALGPDGGIGGMVYAPYGREGVYPMQGVLRALVGGEEPEAQVALAKKLVHQLPPTNGLARNPFVNDHVAGGDAGLYDLLLHGRDRAYDVPGLHGLLEEAGLSLVSFASPGRYDPRPLIVDPEIRERAMALPEPERQALSERLAGNLKTHFFYAVPTGSQSDRIAEIAPDAVPNLLGVTANRLAEAIWKDGSFKASFDGLTIQRRLPKEAAGIVTAIDGKRSLAEISQKLGWKGEQFLAVFRSLYHPLNNFNLLRFSARKTLRSGGTG